MPTIAKELVEVETEEELAHEENEEFRGTEDADLAACRRHGVASRRSVRRGGSTATTAGVSHRPRSQPQARHGFAEVGAPRR